MRTIEITREQAVEQMERDKALEEKLVARDNMIGTEHDNFYSIRVSQLEEVLKNGEGTFSLFKNEEAYVVIK